MNLPLPRRVLLLFLITICLTTADVTASRADAPQVVPVADEPFSASLLAVDQEQYEFLPDVEIPTPQSIPHDGLVRWSHPVAPREGLQLLLSDGSLLVAARDWTNVGVVELRSDSLRFVTRSFGEVIVPREHAAAVLFSPPGPDVDHQRLVDQLANSDEREDVVLLVNGDRFAGRVTQLTNQRLTIETGGAEVQLEGADVLAAAFNPQLVERPAPAPTSWLVGVRDGSLLRASELRVNGAEVALRCLAGVELSGAILDDLASLQAFHPRVAYLSDREPLDYRHVPYLTTAWPYRRDRNLEGGPLVSNANRYAKGLAMHSAARLTYRLDGAHTRFAASVALDDRAGRRGSVVFRVYLVRDGELHEAFASDIVRGGDPPQAIRLDVTDAQALTLVVDYADRGDELDHAVWLDARLEP